MIVTRATLATAVEIADRTVPPVSALSMIEAIRKNCADLQAAIKSHFVKDDPMRIAAVQQVDDCFAKLEDAARAFDVKVMASPSQVDVAYAQILARRARAIDRALLDESGLPGRPWFRNLTIASDRDSGYKGTLLPALTDAQDGTEAQAAAAVLCDAARQSVRSWQKNDPVTLYLLINGSFLLEILNPRL